MDVLTQFFATNGFLPHGYCFQWTSGLLWTYVASDTVIALAYYSIPIALWTFVRRRVDLPFSWIFIMFAVFILACGTTHVMGIWKHLAARVLARRRHQGGHRHCLFDHGHASLAFVAAGTCAAEPRPLTRRESGIGDRGRGAPAS